MTKFPNHDPHAGRLEAMPDLTLQEREKDFRYDAWSAVHKAYLYNKDLFPEGVVGNLAAQCQAFVRAAEPVIENGQRGVYPTVEESASFCAKHAKMFAVAYNYGIKANLAMQANGMKQTLQELEVALPQLANAETQEIDKRMRMAQAMR
jgi:hypothetical protein